MLLEIFMNVTEALVHLFFINALIPAKNKKFAFLQSTGFVVTLTIAYCFLTYFDMNFTLALKIILVSILFIYSTVRNRKFNLWGRLVISFLSLFMIYFSVSIGYQIVYYMYQLTIFEIIHQESTFELLLIVAASRITYLTMAKLVTIFYSKRPKEPEIKQKHMIIATIICGVYTLAFYFLVTYLDTPDCNQSFAIGMIFLVGVILFISLLFYNYIMKNNYIDSLRKLEDQKNVFDNRKLISYTDDIKTLTNLKQEIMELLTPFVQVLNNFEYEEARRMLEDYLAVLDLSTKGIDGHFDDQIKTAINLKVEECRQQNIDVALTVKSDKTQPAIFNNVELVSIITNLFDISIVECNNSGDCGSLYFAFESRETGIYLETGYQLKESITITKSNIIDFLPETLLKISLSKLGGYSTRTDKNGRITRKILLPYVGKAYYLRGANSRQSGVDI